MQRACLQEHCIAHYLRNRNHQSIEKASSSDKAFLFGTRSGT